MRPVLTALLVTLSLTLAKPGLAADDLVIEGRSAQALHCAAMLYMVGAGLYEAGHISRDARDNAQRAALVMLDHVPGTEDQHIRAMQKRFNMIMQTRSPEELFKEYDSTALWCRRAFFKKP